jgi:hypothetical protein
MYKIAYANGQTDTANTYKAAIAAIRAEHPDAAIGHEHDLNDGGDRTLAWADGVEADSDDGENAIAVITRSDD